jgi:hypothetical protein
MENIEERCLEKINKILSKFDLKIESIHLEMLNVWQYRLVDNSLSKTEWLAPWLSISNILVERNSIFNRMKLYYDTINSSNFSYIQLSDIQLSRFQRYSKIYQSIQTLKSCCLEEFLIKCDLMGI